MHNLLVLIGIILMGFVLSKIHNVNIKVFLSFVALLLICIIVDLLDLFGENLGLYTLLIFTISAKVYEYSRENNKEKSIKSIYDKEIVKYEYSNKTDNAAKLFNYRKRKLEKQYDRKTRDNIILLYSGGGFLILSYRLSVAFVDSDSFTNSNSIIAMLRFYIDSINHYIDLNGARINNIFTNAYLVMMMIAIISLIVYIVIHIINQKYKQYMNKKKSG